jgi:excinuclease ABC subunit C
VPLPLQAPETLLIAALRDEAHRFAIAYHRSRRSRITSELDDVRGIGPARRRALLRHFGSLSALRAASLDQLEAMPGLPKSVARTVHESLHRPA